MLCNTPTADRECGDIIVADKQAKRQCPASISFIDGRFDDFFVVDDDCVAGVIVNDPVDQDDRTEIPSRFSRLYAGALRTCARQISPIQNRFYMLSSSGSPSLKLLTMELYPLV
jgi:hypothetical protein